MNLYTYSPPCNKHVVEKRHDDAIIRNPTLNFVVIYHDEFCYDFITSDDDFPVSQLNEVMPSTQTIATSNDSLDEFDVSNLISIETGTAKRKLPDEGNDDKPNKQRFNKIANSQVQCDWDIKRRWSWQCKRETRRNSYIYYVILSLITVYKGYHISPIMCLLLLLLNHPPIR